VLAASRSFCRRRTVAAAVTADAVARRQFKPMVAPVRVALLLLLVICWAGCPTGRAQIEYQHSGGGLTSVVQASIIDQLPPVTPPTTGVRSGELMRTVRLSGSYQADAPLILPSYTRLVLDGSIDALPYKLGWTNESAGPANQTASMVSVKDAQMVSVEGGTWSCASWNSSAAQGNTTTVTAIYFDSTSFSFIRNLKISSCGGYSGGNNSGTFSIGRKYYTSGNIRVSGGSSNVISNVESSFSQSRGIWVQTSKLVVTGGSYHHNNADGIDLDSGSSHCTIHNISAFMNGRMGVFMEFNSAYNAIIGNALYANHFDGVSPGSDTADSPLIMYNVLLANVLGPSAYPAGCPVADRPCPSYCPVNDSCVTSVGLPCGTCHYIDSKGYQGYGFGTSFSSGTIAVLNDLGGSTSGATNGRVQEALIALNSNGTIDCSGMVKDAPNASSSAFSFNPDANSVSISGARAEFSHRGGGLTSVVQASIIDQLPPVTPPTTGVRSGELMRTVRLSGSYQADAPLILPSYTRLVLDGSISALPYKLSWTPGSAGIANMTAAMVSEKDAQMVSVEGGRWSCANWNSSAAQGNTSDVTAVYFENTSFSFIRNLNVSSCGMYSGGPAVYNYSLKKLIGNDSATIGIGKQAYSCGNIHIHAGHSNVIENVHSSYSWMRGLWAQTTKLIVSGGSYHHNLADGIDMDSSTSHSTIHNTAAYMNGRMGIFMEFTASYNTIVGNALYANYADGITTGSIMSNAECAAAKKKSPTYNVLIANQFGLSKYPAGCPRSERPCPSYCPVPRSTCHDTDGENYGLGPQIGFSLECSSGSIAVLNDLGGSVSGANLGAFGSGHVEDALIALNFNGTIDARDMAKRDPDVGHSSAFSFNPDANQTTRGHR
jgi:hypothetical protein